MLALAQKIRERRATCGVIGLGYVGLPLAVAMAKAGFRTIGIDVSASRVEELNQGKNYIQDVDDQELASIVAEGKLSATTDYSVLREVDAIAICVPTPLGQGKAPDVSYVIRAVEQIKKSLRPGQLIILESTTYPGTTDEIALTMLSETGLRVGDDFFLVFSPERIDPGNGTYGLQNTPKIVGGATRNCTEMAQSLYATFVDTVVPVSSTRAAEMAKILENTFRAINIGLANEVALMCNHLNIDTWEVIDAAATKPFGFMPFYPGPGLGGHCIPVDPHYLVWKLKMMDYNPRFIQLADEINSSMPQLVVEKIVNGLNDHKKPVNGSKVLILGVAYKPDIDDLRESPALDVMKLLRERGGEVSYHDPYIPRMMFDGEELVSAPLAEAVGEADCVAVLTHHRAFAIEEIVRKARLVVDTRNATKGLHQYTEKIIKL